MASISSAVAGRAVWRVLTAIHRIVPARSSTKTADRAIRYASMPSVWYTP